MARSRALGEADCACLPSEDDGGAHYARPASLRERCLPIRSMAVPSLVVLKCSISVGSLPTKVWVRVVASEAKAVRDAAGVRSANCGGAGRVGAFVKLAAVAVAVCPASVRVTRATRVI